MNIEDIIKAIRSEAGNVVYAMKKSVEELPHDVVREFGSSYYKSKYLELNLDKIDAFVSTRLVKTRSYTTLAPWTSMRSRWVVYKVAPLTQPAARFKVGRNQRDLWHGSSLATMLSVMNDEGRLRATTLSSCLLGKQGVYVGTNHKAQQYVKEAHEVFHVVEPKKPTVASMLSSVPRVSSLSRDAAYNPYAANVAGLGLMEPYAQALDRKGALRLFQGVLFKCRVDLGRVKVAKASDLYENVKESHDTLAAYKGADLGGKVWHGKLRNSEWVVTPEQIVIDEIHLRLDDTALKEYQQQRRVGPHANIPKSF